jgi:hypothetical protein
VDRERYVQNFLDSLAPSNYKTTVSLVSDGLGAVSSCWDGRKRNPLNIMELRRRAAEVGRENGRE